MVLASMRGLLAAAFASVALAAGGSAGAAVTPAACPPEVSGARCGAVVVQLDPADAAAGTLGIRFELYRHRDRSAPAEGTIVAVEGGPGYATTASRDGYLELFRPLLGRYDLLLVDNRGTGRSGAINCPALQSYKGDYERNARRCGEQLGSASDLYGSALAADDLAAVLDALGIARIHLYGDSYGTFFSQTFAVRHPDRLETLILDAPYPVEGQDPWYRDAAHAVRDGFRFVCERDLRCAASGEDPADLLARAAARLRERPLRGSAYDADGVRRRVVVDGAALALLANDAGYGEPVYRELGAALHALESGDPAPLMRLVAEDGYYGDGGPVREYSEGLYLAVACNDYPQLWDIASPLESRDAQYHASVQALRDDDPEAFAPFSIDDWLGADWAGYRTCITWPAPSNWVPPFPEPHAYPAVPTLLLVGDLDSVTSPEQAHALAARFPDATVVDIANGTHVMAIGDVRRCASVIVRRFVRTAEAGDTSCATRDYRFKLVERFARKAAELRPVPQGGGLTLRDRRAIAVAASTVLDLIPRWLTMGGYEGVGLRGGTFATDGWGVARFRFDRLRWVEDVAVSGRATWNRRTGAIRALVTLTGRATDAGRLTLRWNERDPDGLAQATGTIGGRRVDVVFPAP
jgi:pimeloyl-ACP methyl ester carboxylesterase